jgi:hypothetical protein
MTPVRNAPRDVVRYSTMSRKPAQTSYRKRQSRRLSPVAIPKASSVHSARKPPNVLEYCQSPHSWPFTTKGYCRLRAHRGVK